MAKKGDRARVIRFIAVVVKWRVQLRTDIKQTEQPDRHRAECCQPARGWRGERVGLSGGGGHGGMLTLCIIHYSSSASIRCPIAEVKGGATVALSSSDDQVVLNYLGPGGT